PAAFAPVMSVEPERECAMCVMRRLPHRREAEAGEKQRHHGVFRVAVSVLRGKPQTLECHVAQGTRTLQRVKASAGGRQQSRTEFDSRAAGERNQREQADEAILSIRCMPDAESRMFLVESVRLDDESRFF